MQTIRVWSWLGLNFRLAFSFGWYFGYCFQQHFPSFGAGEVKTPALHSAGNKLSGFCQLPAFTFTMSTLTSANRAVKWMRFEFAIWSMHEILLLGMSDVFGHKKNVQKPIRHIDIVEFLIRSYEPMGTTFSFSPRFLPVLEWAYKIWLPVSLGYAIFGIKDYT